MTKVSVGFENMSFMGLWLFDFNTKKNINSLFNVHSKTACHLHKKNPFGIFALFHFLQNISISLEMQRTRVWKKRVDGKWTKTESRSIWIRSKSALSLEKVNSFIQYQQSNELCSDCFEKNFRCSGRMFVLNWFEGKST